jgi:mercuric ion transport protein
MTARIQVASPEKKSGLLIGSGLLAGFLASLCCIGPLVLTILGVSGAATLAKFEVLRLPMIVIVVAVFAFAGRSLLKKRNVCEPDSMCADTSKWKKMVVAYWAGLVVAIGFISSPYWVAWIWG